MLEAYYYGCYFSIFQPSIYHGLDWRWLFFIFMCLTYFHTGKCDSFWWDLARTCKFWYHIHTCSHCWNIQLHMCTCTGICIPPTATAHPFTHNGHTHSLTHLPSLHESPLQSKNFMYSCYTFQYGLFSFVILVQAAFQIHYFCFLSNFVFCMQK